MSLPLPMNNPPFQFEFGSASDVKWFVADRRNGAVKAIQIRQGLFIVVPSASLLEHKRSSRGLVRDPMRAPPGQMVFLAQELCKLKEERHSLFGVVGTPHRGIEAGYFAGIEIAKTSSAVPEQIEPDPT
jgi:hypothetical protein